MILVNGLVKWILTESMAKNIDIKRTSVWKQHEGGKDILEVLFIK